MFHPALMLPIRGGFASFAEPARLSAVCSACFRDRMLLYARLNVFVDHLNPCRLPGPFGAQNDLFAWSVAATIVLFSLARRRSFQAKLLTFSRR